MKNKLTDNLILKVLSVLMAVLIWIVVLNINDPSKTRVISGIKVMVENESVITDNGQVYTITEGQLISVKVTGPRTIVDSLKADDFNATADFRDLSQANSVPIDVELSDYSYQQKVTINERSNNTIRLEIEDLTEETYEIKVKYTGMAAQDYVLAHTELDTENVKITAPESVHKSIKEVCASVNITDASTDFDAVVPLKVYDNKGVELIQADNHVTTDVTQVKTSNTVYYTKTLPVSYGEITGEGQNIKISGIKLSKTSILLMGRKEHLDKLEEIMLPTEGIVIDGSKNEVTAEYHLEELLPEGVYLNDTVKTVTLTVFLEEIIQKTIAVNVADIGIKNIPDGMDASISTTGKINIKIEGKKQILEELDSSSVSAYVSLKYLKEGISSVPVQLQTPDGVEQMNQVYVDVNLTNTESRQSTTGQTSGRETTDQTTSQTTTDQQETTPQSNGETTGSGQQQETTTEAEDDTQSET